MSLRKHLATTAAYVTFFESLQQGQATVFELREESGLALATVRKLLLIMKRRKMVYIAAWTKDAAGRFTLAVYTLGDKPDAVRPKKQTPTQRSAKRRVVQRLRIIHNLGRPSLTN